MKKKIDMRIGHKFAVATGILATRVFSTPLEANTRRLMIACGPVMGPDTVTPDRRPIQEFDVLGLGFRPGREWDGPSEIFVEEMRAGRLRTWNDCRLWADALAGPLYLLTDDPETSFSFDGHSLVALSGTMQDREAGTARAMAKLRAGARLVPDEFQRHPIM